MVEMAVELTPLFIPGGFGGPELVIILLIAVLLFGANKIPKLARSTGQALGEFQRGREEIEQELNEVREGATSQDQESNQTESADTSDADTTSADTTSADDTTERANGNQ